METYADKDKIGLQCTNDLDVSNLCIVIIFFYWWGGTFGIVATTGLLYQPRMIGDGGEIGGMKIGRGNRSIRRKPAPAPLCQLQIPHD
jgi:hypothetical protein